MPPFTKPPLNLDDQIDHLKNKGLIIGDVGQAKLVLERIGLYRFKGFGLTYHNPAPDKTYKTGTTFEAINRIIDLDEKLRLHILKAIQCLEIGIRLKINEHMLLRYNDHCWYTEPNHYIKKFDHIGFMTKSYSAFMRSKETFVESYKNKYGTREYPPSWMLIEVLSFGNWSILYEGLADDSNKDDIASAYKIHRETLQDWLKNLVVLRNVCAHHSKVWDRKFKPMRIADTYPKSVPVGLKARVFSPNDKQGLRLAPRLFVLNKLMKVLDQNSTWFTELKTLLQNYNSTELEQLGFRVTWAGQPEWL